MLILDLFFHVMVSFAGLFYIIIVILYLFVARHNYSLTDIKAA